MVVFDMVDLRCALERSDSESADRGRPTALCETEWSTARGVDTAILGTWHCSKPGADGQPLRAQTGNSKPAGETAA